MRTPRWLGYLIQRPESHRIHHRCRVHTNNYADLPLFDMMFGTFDSTFNLRWQDESGAAQQLEITPKLYARLAGPYNRRNVYGAALAYAPRLPEALWQPIYCYGLGADGPLRREFGLPASTEGLVTEIVTRTRGRTDRWLLEPDCE